MSTEKTPLVSVIIPMYNAAKFITQTLESLLYQTMKDFEVVIVDDCSTDNSVEVVESFAPKLIQNGVKVYIAELPENIGMPGVVRNVGIDFAHGKYLAFLDNDDFFTKTALEELTTLAEQYQADVVNMPTVYYVKDNYSNMEELFDSANYSVDSCYGKNVPLLDKIIEVSDNIEERIKFWLDDKFHWAAWSSFIRRDFWIANHIKFPEMPVSDDTIASFSCLCLAKKILSVPNIIYIQRKRADSISREKDLPGKLIHKWLSNILLGFKAFDEIMSHIPFFSRNPDYRYSILDWFFRRNIYDALQFPTIYLQVSPAFLHQLAEKEFLPDNAALSAYLFNAFNLQLLQIMNLREENNALKQSLAQK